MTTVLPTTAKETVSIEIGGTAIALHTEDALFRRLIENRYEGFVGTSPSSRFHFDIDLYEPSESAPAEDGLDVKIEAGEWVLQRGDFHARWNPGDRRGLIRQSCSPYAIDCVLRHRAHSSWRGKEGSWFMPLSAIRGGKAFCFRGFRRGQNNDLPSCTARCDAADR